MPRPTAIQAPTPKKLTRDKLRERSTKELCWHCDEPWSREHHCKKGRLLVIEPAEDEDNETSEEAMEEVSQPANYAVHALTGYSNPQIMKATRRGAATYGQTPYRDGIHDQATYRGVQLWPRPLARAIACGQALWRGGQATRDSRQWPGLPAVRAIAPRNDLK
ncbi:hypothetical protein B296_00025231 [Ensete ventricosum]|uniref:Uncharacterized protein n=1 Tax=Ensete ventricosum TaxID=4639 RepID=A0A426XSV3_ENSVE|nr:hypothetical protein B296_00025231 [Ensete ventricosum]